MHGAAAPQRDAYRHAQSDTVFCPRRPTPSAVRDGPNLPGGLFAGARACRPLHACSDTRHNGQDASASAAIDPSRTMHGACGAARPPRCVAAACQARPSTYIRSTQHLHAPAPATYGREDAYARPRSNAASLHTAAIFPVHTAPSRHAPPSARAPAPSARRTPRTRALPILIAIGASAFGRRAPRIDIYIDRPASRAPSSDPHRGAGVRVLRGGADKLLSIILHRAHTAGTRRTIQRAARRVATPCARWRVMACASARVQRRRRRGWRWVAPGVAAPRRGHVRCAICDAIAIAGDHADAQLAERDMHRDLWLCAV